jgi:hypothetical protein
MGSQEEKAADVAGVKDGMWDLSTISCNLIKFY